MPSSPQIIVQKCSTFNLRGITVIISRASWTIVAGPPGSGKSALLKYSLAAEASKRLERLHGAGMPQSMVEFSPAVGQIMPVVPVVDLNQRLAALSDLSGRAGSVGSIGAFLGIVSPLVKLFSLRGALRCADDGGALVSLDPSFAADRLLKLKEAGAPQGVDLAICGQIEPKSGEKSAEAAARRLVQAGVKRFVLAGKYQRLSPDRLPDRILPRGKSSSDKPPLAVIQTLTLAPELDKAELVSALKKALEQSNTSGIFRRFVVLPALPGGDFDWTQAVELAPGTFRCEICSRAVKFEAGEFAAGEFGGGEFGTGGADSGSAGYGGKSPKRIDFELHGTTLSSLLKSPLGPADREPAISWAGFFSRLEPQELQQPGLRAALELVNVLVDSGLGAIHPAQPAQTLSSGERLFALFSAIAATAGRGAVYLLSHSASGLSASDLDRLLRLTDRVIRAGNGVIFEERTILPFAGKSGGRFLLLGPGGGARGGNVVSSGDLIDQKPSRNLQHGQTARARRSAGAVVKISGSGFEFEAGPGTVAAITGGIGSGKSSLIADLSAAFSASRLRRAKAKKPPAAVSPGRSVVAWSSDFARSAQLVAFFERAKIGLRTAVHLGLDRPLAAIYSQTAEARRAGFSQENFLFGSSAARCLECRGRGTVTANLQPYGAVRIACRQCLQTGFSQQILSFEYRGLSYASALTSEIAELLEQFSSRRELAERMRQAVEFGLGHLSLAAADDQITAGDAALLALISQAWTRQASHQRRKPAVVLIDRPIYLQDNSDNARLAVLLRSIIAEDGVAFFTTSFGANENGRLQIRLEN